MENLKHMLCIYCHEDNDGYVQALDKNGHAYIAWGDSGMNRLILRFGKERRETPIFYCPICGRRLDE